MDVTQEKTLIKGKHVAITGILAFYKRKDAYDQIDVRGGYSQSNVTKNTDYLVIGYHRPNSIHDGKLCLEPFISSATENRVLMKVKFENLV